MQPKPEKPGEETSAAEHARRQGIPTGESEGRDAEGSVDELPEVGGTRAASSGIAREAPVDSANVGQFSPAESESSRSPAKGGAKNVRGQGTNAPPGE